MRAEDICSSAGGQQEQEGRESPGAVGLPS